VTETKAEKFERVAAPRIENATKAMNLLNNLSGSAYESTLERRAEIIAHLQTQLDGLAFAWAVTSQQSVPVPQEGDNFENRGEVRVDPHDAGPAIDQVIGHLDEALENLHLNINDERIVTHCKKPLELSRAILLNQMAA